MGRLEEVDAQLAELAEDPFVGGPYDENSGESGFLAVESENTRIAELEGEKRGLEAGVLAARSTR
jgi:hypothetical protein